MLKGILIGLDGSRDSESAVELGLRWAKRHDATAVGLAVVDEPGIQISEVGVLTEAHHWHATAPYLAEARRQASETLRAFEKRCEAAGVRHSALEESGSPYVEILEELQRFDLLLLGQRTHFDYGWQERSDETLVRVLKDAPRPVVVVPTNSIQSDTVLIAYDRSLQAARALAAFEASGLGRSCAVHVVGVAGTREEAVRHTDRAVEYLRAHEINATPHAIDTRRSPDEVILKEAEKLEAGLLVMGAYGQPTLREFFLGSVTKSVLTLTRTPVFCFH